MSVGADFSRTCEGCENIREEPGGKKKNGDVQMLRAWTVPRIPHGDNPILPVCSGVVSTESERNWRRSWRRMNAALYTTKRRRLVEDVRRNERIRANA